MEINTKNIIIFVVAALLLIAGIIFLIFPNNAVSKRVEGALTMEQLAEKTGCQKPEAGANLDDFAKCITASGAKFYGAFWCPHCEDQKKLFGDSAQYLPYVECSTEDSKGQLQVCADAGVQVYPTWEFK